MRTFVPALFAAFALACSPGTTPADSGNPVDAGSCSTANCAGCCQDGTCLTGNERVACGVGGVACRECNLQQYCAQRNGEYLCSSNGCTEACDGGCCNQSTGQCDPGTSSTACGSTGGWCHACATNCVNQQCQ